MEVHSSQNNKELELCHTCVKKRKVEDAARKMVRVTFHGSLSQRVKQKVEENKKDNKRNWQF